MSRAETATVNFMVKPFFFEKKIYATVPMVMAQIITSPAFEFTVFSDVHIWHQTSSD
jgi:hypothetical protein